jgi:hypothetical protein
MPEFRDHVACHRNWWAGVGCDQESGGLTFHPREVRVQDRGIPYAQRASRAKWPLCECPGSTDGGVKMSFRKRSARVVSGNSGLTNAPLRPEDELLLCAARARTNPEIAARMKNLMQLKMDWKRLLAAARWHGLAPLLYTHLQSACAGEIPESILLKLGRQFIANAARNLSMTAELVRILALFEDHGIPALPYKGPLLAESIYGDVALRQFEDLDILVPESKVAEAEILLREQGYQMALELPQDRMAAYRRMKHEIPYLHPGKTILIELHWKFSPIFFHFPIDMERLWKRTEWIILAGSRVRSLSKEDALLMLCANGSRHLWEKLELVGAVAEMLRVYPEMNWEYLFGLARDLKSEQVLLLGLFISHSLFNTEIPEPAVQRIWTDGRLRMLAAEVQTRLFSNLQSASGMERFFLSIRIADRWQDRAWIILRILFLPQYEDWRIIKLPSRLAFLYFPFRIFRILKKHAVRPFHGFFHASGS